MNLVILGAQWGDEGKGKVVVLLSENYEVVVRYQGGSNAGHTVVINGEKYILHLLPTGILHPHTVGVIAQGMVVDLELLVKEIKDIESKGLRVRDRLFISDRAHLVLPYHKVLDSLLERKGKIGTTLRGIGPAYMLKYARKGIRVCDLGDKDRFYSLVKDNLEFVEELCKKVYCENFELKIEEVVDRSLENFEEVKDCVIDTSQYLLEKREGILFEGAQGTLLDVDIGTYPYVTSSNSSALGLSAGTGLPAKFGLVASGTAELELSLLEVPHVVFYRVNPITYWVGKRLAKVSHIALTNLILKEGVIPEVVQRPWQELVSVALNIDVQRQKEAFARLRTELGGEGSINRLRALFRKLLSS